jgi:hypothetical protein
MPQLKLGILLDSFTAPRWQREILESLLKAEFFHLDVILINAQRRNPDTSRVAYKAFRKLERNVFKVQHDAFGRVNLLERVGSTGIIEVHPVAGKYTDEFPADIVQGLKARKLDVILRFGFRILKGEILQAAKFGVWSLHHGDNAVNRGGPPGFWEVVNREQVTGVTLLQLTETLDAGRVMGKAFVRTDTTSFNRNQNAVFWAGVELFSSCLKELAVSGKLPAEESAGMPSIYSGPIYRDPDNLAATKIAFGFFWRRLASWAGSALRSPQWRILYRFSKSDTPVHTLYSYKHLKPPSGHDWADPFPYVVDGRYFVFLEEFVRSRKKAHISCVELTERGPVNAKPEVVLQEGHHLSYPFVFKYGDKHYLIPESGSAGKVCLYETSDFPRAWKVKKVLIEKELYDSTVVELGGMWYLFATAKPFPGNSPHQYLYIYYATDPVGGTWTLHPKSPVTRTVIGARPAGRIFRHEGKLIRPGQIGAPRYGYAVRFFEVVRLTAEEYEERPLNDILPNFSADVLGVHTFNQTGKLTVIDGQFR